MSPQIFNELKSLIPILSQVTFALNSNVLPDERRSVKHDAC